jgi:hypothetical protein
MAKRADSRERGTVVALTDAGCVGNRPSPKTDGVVIEVEICSAEHVSHADFSVAAVSGQVRESLAQEILDIM